MAEALESGVFDDVPLANATPSDVSAEVEEITGGMGETSRAVELVDIDRTGGDDTREATFEVAWALADTEDEWIYTTTASLEFTGEEWLVEWSPSTLHPQLEDGGRLALRTSQAERGDVLAADGTPIVTERPVFRIGIDKTTLDGADPDSSAAELAAAVGVDPDGFADRVEASGPKAFVEAITYREDDAEAVLPELDKIAGARAIPGTMALAPTREFARPVLGTVGEATAEIVEDSDGQINPGDVVGLSGLQQQYDEQLRGQRGIAVELIPADGDPEVVFERDATPGDAVTTTLDIDLQLHAERVLADVGPASALVAVQPSTGNVLAAASGPSGDGYATATLGEYAPGSTFKIDYPDAALGNIAFTDAIAHSCNTALIDQRDTVTQADLADAASSLGLGLANPGVPAFAGAVPVEADTTEHAASMIGQGKVLASPLAMATVAASVAAGQTVVPTLIQGADTLPESDPAPLSEDEAGQLRTMMRAAVDYGSATFLGDVPGEPVGAKTGTAEYGTDDPPRTHGWMIAIQGDLAVAAFVEDAESGSHTAGPLLKEFLANE
jgi:cell division protein FtsI/penicillin-binding protein 2